MMPDKEILFEFCNRCEASEPGDIVSSEAIPFVVHRYEDEFVALWKDPKTAEDLGMEFDDIQNLRNFVQGKPFKYRKLRR